jgi:hypothetical protein
MLLSEHHWVGTCPRSREINYVRFSSISVMANGCLACIGFHYTSSTVKVPMNRRGKHTLLATSIIPASSNQHTGRTVTKLAANGMPATAVPNDMEIESALRQARTCSKAGKMGKGFWYQVIRTSWRGYEVGCWCESLSNKREECSNERSCPAHDIEFVLG